jgi:hypothetical protein
MPVPTMAPTPSATRCGHDKGAGEPVMLRHFVAADGGLAVGPVVHELKEAEG